MTLVLDVEFGQRHGSNAAATAVAMLNIVEGFYSAQAATQVSLHALKALAGNGSLTSTNAHTLLDAFVDYGRAGHVAFSGVAHLLSGKDFDGHTAGLAYVGVVCNPNWGYGVDQATFSAAAASVILAHEIGHNYDARHDGDGNSCPASGYIMQPSVNLGALPTGFSSCSLDSFQQFRGGSPPACMALPDLILANGFERGPP